MLPERRPHLGRIPGLLQAFGAGELVGHRAHTVHRPFACHVEYVRQSIAAAARHQLQLRQVKALDRLHRRRNIALPTQGREVDLDVPSAI